MNTFCPECGFGVKVDEDLCCVYCGATAAGSGVDELVEMLEHMADNCPVCEGVGYQGDRHGAWNCEYCGPARELLEKAGVRT